MKHDAAKQRAHAEHHPHSGGSQARFMTQIQVAFLGLLRITISYDATRDERTAELL